MRNHWIQTLTGNAWDANAPEDYDYDISEIAIALSHLCRFGGHTKKFYSVAQHSVLVYRICKINYPGSTKGLYRSALMHDASEAFVGDMPSPIKSLMTMQGYADLELRVQRAIAKQFRIRIPFNDLAIASSDLIALAMEKRDVMGKGIHGLIWGVQCNVLKERIHPVQPHKAAKLFLDAWAELMLP